jgi:hypothetical protein
MTIHKRPRDRAPWRATHHPVPRPALDPKPDWKAVADSLVEKMAQARREAEAQPLPGWERWGGYIITLLFLAMYLCLPIYFIWFVR